MYHANVRHYNRGKGARVYSYRGVWELFVLSAQFIYKCKIALTKSIKLKHTKKQKTKARHGNYHKRHDIISLSGEESSCD